MNSKDAEYKSLEKEIRVNMEKELKVLREKYMGWIEFKNKMTKNCIKGKKLKASYI